jgi:hypothetical protein
VNIDRVMLELLRENGVTSIKWDAQGNVLELVLGKAVETSPMQQVAELTPEQLREEAERLLYAAVE